MSIPVRLQYSPYTEEQWQQIDALGLAVEEKLQHLGVGLTMGGEPTFVSLDDFESPQWQVEALGEEKRKIAVQLLQRLKRHFAKGGGLLHYGLGKWYPGEELPRWALGCYWRKDGVPIWREAALLAEDGQDCGHTHQAAAIFMQALAQRLGVNPDCLIPAWEPETEALAGYTLPLLSVFWEGQLRWSSCPWQLADHSTTFSLLPGTSQLGLRLPLKAIAWAAELAEEAIAPLSHPPVPLASPPLTLSPNSICVALSVEVRQGTLHAFLPPLASARSFLDLIAAIEDTAAAVAMPVLIEGYPPPINVDIQGFQLTPDPGVLEVNIHPAASWTELVQINALLYQEAQQCRLGTLKYARDGRPISTGGGAHITIGGETVTDSPLLRRPDLLRSLITYWQNHPSLSYLFSGQFVGPTSQSPRVDEARHESLYELEIAFQTLSPQTEVPPEIVDRLLRHLLVDVTGNTHRTAFCLDKLFPRENPRAQLGLLEFRAFAMPPQVGMRLLEMLLVRAFVAWFWQQPYRKPLIRWGTALHDRFLLPHYLEEDLKEVLRDLQEAGYAFAWDWFLPCFEFRFPRYGAVSSNGVQLELRHAIETWHVLGEEMTSGRTSRPVDDSMERIQVRLQGATGNSHNVDNFSSRYVVTCNGQRIPLKSTGVPGEYVGAVRFRARQSAAMLHPAIAPHNPLVFAIVDTWKLQSLGGCTYSANPPKGKTYHNFPVNSQEAALRMQERFVPNAPLSGNIKVPPLQLNPEYPLTLDLRRVNFLEPNLT